MNKICPGTQDTHLQAVLWIQEGKNDPEKIK